MKIVLDWNKWESELTRFFELTRFCCQTRLKLPLAASNWIKSQFFSFYCFLSFIGIWYVFHSHIAAAKVQIRTYANIYFFFRAEIKKFVLSLKREWILVNWFLSDLSPPNVSTIFDKPLDALITQHPYNRRKLSKRKTKDNINK